MRSSICGGTIISIHSLRMEGDGLFTVSCPLFCVISIHSLRMEGDSVNACYLQRVSYFNPLPPHGGRPPTATTPATRRHFNPLPPHGGRLSSNITFLSMLYFNPLPPHGGRQGAPYRVRVPETFQSTPSAWRETLGLLPHRVHHEISIHSLRMEGDFAADVMYSKLSDFNPLPPHGGRLSMLPLQVNR